MNVKNAIFILALIFNFAITGFAESPDVQIQKKEERTEAIVTSKKMSRPDVSVLDRSFSAMENGVMGVVTPISYWTGKAVDTVVTGVAKAGSFVFSPIVRFADFKK